MNARVIVIVIAVVKLAAFYRLAYRGKKECAARIEILLLKRYAVNMRRYLLLYNIRARVPKGLFAFFRVCFPKYASAPSIPQGR